MRIPSGRGSGRVPGRAAAAAWFFLVVAGCGDDEPAIDPQADQALIDAAVLTPEDLPDGFTVEPVDDPDDDTALDACVEETAGVSRAELEDARTARTERMELANETAQLSFRPRLNAFENDDVPEEVIDAFDDDEFLDCIREGIGAEMTDAGIEMVSLEPVDPAFGPADAVAYDLRLLLDSEGTEVESRVMALLVDRYVVALEATGLSGQLDDAVLTDAIETMASRLDSD